MKRPAFSLLLAATVIAALPALAHHAFSAMYDDGKLVTISGVLTKVEWVNPHVYFYVDGKAGANGTSQQWALESHPPMALRRAGLPRDMLVVGQTLKVEAYPSRDGQPVAFAKSVLFPDGKLVRIMLDPKQDSAAAQ